MAPILTDLQALIGTFQARGAALDDHAAFPAENIHDLRRIGALAAPLPRSLGGMGAGCEAAGAALIRDMLVAIGRGSLATGRLFEGHVNAIKLVVTYGAPEVLAMLARDVLGGHLFGLWVTEAPPGLRVDGAGALQGGKVFCSGAGHVARALVTAQPPESEPVMALVALDGALAQPSAMRLSGMRAAVTGSVDLSGLQAELVGEPGDYLRQPEFSAGAWRTSAVTAGGLAALVDYVRRELVSRGRAGNAHQRARVGHMLVAQQTALLWVRRAAALAEQGAHDPGDVAAGVNLARIAVEGAVLDAVRLAQRALGLSAFAMGHPVERLIRDLGTYLRQPAPDETLTEAAAWFFEREMPA